MLSVRVTWASFLSPVAMRAVVVESLLVGSVTCVAHAREGGREGINLSVWIRRAKKIERTAVKWVRALTRRL